MGLWRCQNLACAEGKAKENGQCIYDFEGPIPKCPKCQLDGREFPNAVIKRTLIHFEAPGRTIGSITAGSGELACEPGKKLTPGTVRSGAPMAVTCAACRQTDAWRASMEAHGEIVPEKDFPVEVDAGAGVIRLADPDDVPEIQESPPLPSERAG